MGSENYLKLPKIDEEEERKQIEEVKEIAKYLWEHFDGIATSLGIASEDYEQKKILRSVRGATVWQVWKSGRILTRRMRANHLHISGDKALDSVRASHYASECREIADEIKELLDDQFGGRPSHNVVRLIKIIIDARELDPRIIPVIDCIRGKISFSDLIELQTRKNLW